MAGSPARHATMRRSTDPLVAKTFNAWAGLAKAGYFNKNALSLNYAGMQQEFLDGKEAMYPMGTWAASKTAVGAAKFGVGVFRLPSFSGPPVQAVFTNGGVLVARPAGERDAGKERRGPHRHEELQAADGPPARLLPDCSPLQPEEHEGPSAEERRRDVLQQR